MRGLNEIHGFFKNLFYQFLGQIYGSKEGEKKLIFPNPHNSRGPKCLSYRIPAVTPDLCSRMPKWPEGTFTPSSAFRLRALFFKVPKNYQETAGEEVF